MGYPKSIVVLSVCALIVVVVISAFEFGKQEDKPFVYSSMYVGVESEPQNPKDYYNDLTNATVAESVRCTTVAKTLENNDVFGNQNAYWISTTKIKSEESSIVAMEEDGYDLKPFLDGDKIIAPTNLEFLNTNTSMIVAGRIDIIAKIVPSYQIEFEDVGAWFCHMGIKGTPKHTAVIGANGKSSTVVANSIIGVAKASTTVKLFKIDSNGKKLDQISLADLYF